MWLHPGTRRQIIAAAIANMMAFASGIITNWISANYRHFTSDESPIGPLSTTYLSWLSSLPFLSAISGIFIWGNLSEKIGRKKTGLILALPQTTMYAMLYLSHNQSIVLLSRFIGGFSNVGCIMCVTLYVKETASTELRSKLSNMITLSMVCGALFTNTLGALVSYDTLNLLSFLVCVLYLLLFYLMPESPIYYIKNNDFDSAKKSLQWLRQTKDETLLTKEIDELKETFLNKASIDFFDIFRNKYYIKTMLIGVFLQTCIINATGFSVICTFNTQIFESLMHTKDIAVYNIVFTLLQLVGGSVTFFIVDKCGRKFYIVTSCFLLSLILAIIACCYFINYYPFQLFPALLLFLYIFIFGAICFPVIYTYFNEIITSESSNHIFTLMVLGKNLGWFCSVKLYVHLLEYVDVATILALFSIGSLTVCVLTLFFPESRNKSIQMLKDEMHC